MSRRFSKEVLYQLRNSIPIDYVIGSILKIPSKTVAGVWRFLCPLCSEFQTATNPRTNLARCFRCGKNFNAIDLIMIARNKSFIDSVDFLKKVLRRKMASQDPSPSEVAAPPASGLSSIAEVLRTHGFAIKGKDGSK